MNVVFRADASVQIGTGHVMRCLTLAHTLRARGVTCLFVCRKHEGHLIKLIRNHGYEVIGLPPPDCEFAPQDSGPAHSSWLGVGWEVDAEQTQVSLGARVFDWLVVDHYGLDYRWERMLRRVCSRIMVIDDLADRSHNCDLLLDQNLGRLTDGYRNLLPDSASALIGPKYALLRPEFSKLRKHSLSRRKNPKLKNLLITLGGVDRENVTSTILKTITSSSLLSEMQIKVVMGSQSPWVGEVQRLATQLPLNLRVLVDAPNMAEIMMESDLAIGAAGGTSWERCCLGLPTIQVVLSENQKIIARSLELCGAAITVKKEELPQVIRDPFYSLDISRLLTSMTENSSKITDGLGANRVTNEIERIPI